MFGSAHQEALRSERSWSSPHSQAQFVERLVAKGPVWCARPADVVEVGGVDRVVSGARDDASLVLGMNVRFFAGDEARSERNGLGPEAQRACNAHPVTDPPRGQHGQR